VKIVVNRCFGGFELSKAAYKELGLKWDGYGGAYREYAKRTNKKLIAVVEKLGSEKASGELAQLEVVEIPDGIDWEIDDYDGVETIHEKHRSW
jgi:hypothetical protein